MRELNIENDKKTSNRSIFLLIFAEKIEKTHNYKDDFYWKISFIKKKKYEIINLSNKELTWPYFLI